MFVPSARSERYHHLASDEDEETNDEESSLEIRQFASWSHRFSKVKAFINKVVLIIISTFTTQSFVRFTFFNTCM